MGVIHSIAAEIQKNVIAKVTSAVVGTAALVTAGVTVKALRTDSAHSTTGPGGASDAPATPVTLSNSAMTQSPGGAPPAGGSSTPPSSGGGSGGSAAPGGVTVEYQADFGSGAGSEGKDARDQANDFLAEKGWTEGRNPNGMWVVVGKASLPCGASDGENFDQCRRQAFQEAMFGAKKELVQMLSAEVSTQMESEYKEGDGLKRAAEAKMSDVAAEPGLFDKVLALADAYINEQLKAKGIDLGSPEAKAWSDQQKQQAIAQMRKEAEQLLTSSSFKSAVQVVARHQVSGLQAYRSFEFVPPGKNGSIAVVAIYSDKSAELQQALLGLRPAPAGAPKEPIGPWAKQQGASALLYTHGAQVRTNEAGEVVLVAFGQSTPITDSERAFDAAEKKARVNAMAEARRFLGEMVMAQEQQVEASTLKEFADKSSDFKSQQSYEESIKSTAEKLSMPGGDSVWRWKMKHPLSGKTTAGVVMVYSVSEALQANKLRDRLNAAGGAAGGRGIADKRPATSAPAGGASKPKSGGGSGTGAEGEAP